MPIHPTAIIDKTAEIDESADIGAYAVVEAKSRIGAGTRLWPHAYVAAFTTIGQRCQIHPFAMVGHEPQDFAYKGTESYTEIGDETIIREHASVHRGTMPGSTTLVGRRCFIMSTAHVGHNCVVGDEVKLANGAVLGGHVRVGDKSFLAGATPVHQFVRIGELAMVSRDRVITDIAPFMIAAARGIIGPNVIGLRRAGFTPTERLELRQCHRILFRSGLLFRRAIEQVAEVVKTDSGRRLLAFVRETSKRGYLGYTGKHAEADDSDNAE